MKERNNNKSELEEYNFDKRQRRSMKKNKSISQFQFVEEAGGTIQLPAGLEASLFVGITEPHRLIRKFRKTEPESYLAVDTLLKDETFLSSGVVFVRENNFGLIPVLLALSHRGGLFLVSSWMIDRKEIIEKNIVTNLVEDRVDLVTEGLQVAAAKENYDTAILVHEQYQNPEIIVYEAARLLSTDTCGALYLITHKKKGGVSIVERISHEIRVNASWIKRGVGGAMVIKFVKEKPIAAPIIPMSEFDYYPTVGVRIKFQTVPSLFSPEGIDIGTDFLIKEALSGIDPQQEISVYDLACGYGAVGLSLAGCLSHATVVMSDADARAVDVARLNVQANNLSDRVSVELTNGAEGIRGNFDLVISNPPLHTERRKLIEILTRANKLVRKRGRMLLVVEDSRVTELKEILEPYTGFIREKAKTPSHSVLEISK